METYTIKNELLPAIARWQAAGERVAMATVVWVEGTAPRQAGARLVASARGELAGSVSGGCVEGAVLEEARRVLRSGQPVRREYGITADMLTDVGLSCGGRISVFVEALDSPAAAAVYPPLFDLIAQTGPAALATVIGGPCFGAKLLVPADGPVAGGIDPGLDDRIATDARLVLAAESAEGVRYPLGTETVEVFIESFPPAPRLVIVGAVHIAIPLHRLAHLLGYHVTVIDPRGMLATPARFPEADAVLVEWPDDAMATLGLDSASAVVVLAHDPKFDLPALQTALGSPALYIGAIGSRGTNTQRIADLRALGLSDDAIARIHAPIGLDLGAETPAEIALAIMAEILATREHRPGGSLSGSSLVP